MTHTFYHAKSSARVFGGVPEDYLPIHNWFDATKQSFCDFRHRAMRHHAEGIFEAERVFGTTITNSNDKQVTNVEPPGPIIRDAWSLRAPRRTK